MHEGIGAEEAYGAVAGEMYIPGETDYRSPADVLAELEPEIVAKAKSFAERTNRPWPPIASGLFGWIGTMTFDSRPVRVEEVGSTTVYHLADLPPRDYDETIDGPCES